MPAQQADTEYSEALRTYEEKPTASEPILLLDPIPVDPIARDLQRTLAFKPFSIRFRIAPDGSVADCRILNVNGDTDLQRLIPQGEQLRLCGAIEARRYEVGPTSAEVTLTFVSPHLQ